MKHATKRLCLSLNRIYRILNRRTAETDVFLSDSDLREFGIWLSKFTADLRGDPEQYVLHQHLNGIASVLARFGQIKHRGVTEDLGDLTELIERFTQAKTEAGIAGILAGFAKKFLIRSVLDRMAVMCEDARNYLCYRRQRIERACGVKISA